MKSGHRLALLLWLALLGNAGFIAPLPARSLNNLGVALSDVERRGLLGTEYCASQQDSGAVMVRGRGRMSRRRDRLMGPQACAAASDFEQDQMDRLGINQIPRDRLGKPGVPH